MERFIVLHALATEVKSAAKEYLTERTDDGQQADLGQYELPKVDESSGILIVSAMHTTLIDDGTTIRSLSIQVFLVLCRYSNILLLQYVY